MKYLIGYMSGASKPHKHKNYEIIVYLNGSGTVSTPQKDFFVSSGKIIIIPPNTLHSSNSTEDTDKIFISGDFSHLFSSTSPSVISDDSACTGVSLARIIYRNRHSNPEYISALINAFAHFLLQNLKYEKEIGIIVKNIADKISENFYDFNLNLNNLLNSSGYAEDYIRAQFKAFTGKTPTEFLTETRISHACYLINMYKDSLSLYEISEKCGYTDYVYFSRRFKQFVGISPKKYIENQEIENTAFPF